MPRKRRPDYLARVRRQENVEGVKLRKISSHVSELIKTWAQSHPEDVLNPAHVPELVDQMDNYQRAITPWAHANVTRMTREVAAKERRAWEQHAAEMSEGMKQVLKRPPIGPAFGRLRNEMAAQVKSIPQDAAQRIYKIVGQALSDPVHHTEYIAQIMEAGAVSRSRANTLARTMVSSTAAALIQARALHAGSTAYYWETQRDGAVRPSHRRMQGRLVYWNDPPTLDGWTGHPGTAANCRCWARPIWPHLG
jgi:SPP1 gp7 family putative phage head morphogenesis protein